MTLTIALPVLNEELVLRPSIQAIRTAIQPLTPKFQTNIVIADNDSSDRTSELGQALASEHSDVHYLRLNQRGKGLAIRQAWEHYPADILMFMDADLSTDLAALSPLLTSLDTNDIAIGSRWSPKAQVTRPIGRSFLSNGYRLAVHWSLGLPVSDLPCGFKAIKGQLWQQIAPTIKNNSWFFDTELLFRAHQLGASISELPVTWTDGGAFGRPSRAIPWKVILEYLSELYRLHRE